MLEKKEFILFGNVIGLVTRALRPRFSLAISYIMASVLTLSPPQVPVIGKCASVETMPVAPQTLPTWPPAEVDFAKLSAADIASCDGLLILRDVLPSMDSRAALAEIGALLDEVAARPELGARANQAYTKNMVRPPLAF